MSRWQPLTVRDNPAAHVRTDVIPFVLTEADKSVAAQASVQIEAHRRRQNALEAQQGLATWKGAMHRVGEAL